MKGYERAAHLDLVWQVVKQALEWHAAKDHVLKRAMASVELGKACTALRKFEDVGHVKGKS